VDDDKVIREALSAMLQSQGYDATSVASAKEALEKNATRSFDLVLLDISLPHNEGTQLLSDFNRVTPETIRVMITGSPSLKNATEALNYCADLYLTKPIDPDNLLKAIRGKLEEREETERITGRKMVEWVRRRARKTQLTDIQEFSEKTANEFGHFGLTKTQARANLNRNPFQTLPSTTLDRVDKCDARSKCSYVL
jgi:DNA-binding NtrC family response regulator